MRNDPVISSKVSNVSAVAEFVLQPLLHFLLDIFMEVIVRGIIRFFLLIINFFRWILGMKPKRMRSRKPITFIKPSRRK